MNLHVAVLCSVLCALASAHPRQRMANPDLDPHWENFKTSYGKAYENHFEFVRRIIWEDNLEYIQKHNLEYDMGQHTYSLGMNEFGDLTHKEFLARFTGLNMAHRNGTGAIFMAPLNMDVESLAETVDWRTKGFVTPVKNQGQCGSCWAFSTTGSMEGQYKRKTGQLVSFSEQQLVDCSGDFGNMGCNGGLMDNGFRYIEKFGIEKESDYPYNAHDNSCKYDASKVVTKCSGYVDIPSKDENALQKAVATQGPISVAIDAGHMSFQFYRHGVYSEMECSQTQLDHGVLAVGYGTLSGKDYWLVKNSWGNTWGQSGYIMMTRNQNNQCGIATQASYPTL